MLRLRVVLSALFILPALARRDRSIIDLSSSTNKDYAADEPDKPAKWDEFTRNGTRFWQRWKDRSGPDHTLSYRVGRIFDITVIPGTFLTDPLKESLRKAHLSTDGDDYTEYSYIWPRMDQMNSNINHKRAHGRNHKRGQDPDSDGEDPPCPEDETQKTALFECTIDAKAGTFIAESINRGDVLPAHIKFSAVAWDMWVRQTRRTYGSQVSDFSRLSTYWMADVVNDDAYELLEYIFHDLGEGDYLFHPYGIEPATKNPFWALLGSANGRTIIFMLTDFKNAMGGKGISGIWVDVFESEESPGVLHYNMWAEIELMDPVPE